MSRYHALILSCNFSSTSRLGGGYRIATFLRKQGWDVEVIDYVMYWSLDELKELMKSRVTINTKFIGFSTLWSMWNDHINSLLRWIKDTYQHVITVIGGQQCQMIDADPHYFVNGYGENAILAIIDWHFSNNGSPITLDTNWISNGKKVVRHADYPSAPLRSLLIEYEDRDYIDQTEWLPIEFSRGCKFECKFCNYPILGVKSDYSRDASDLDYHMRNVYERFGVTNYYVSDETFNDNIDKMRKFAKVTSALPFTPYFSGFVRADLIVARSEDRELLVELGFFGQYYGIETMNAKTGKIIGKGMSPDKLMPGLLDLRSYFKKHGHYRGEISLIVGLPEETEETMQSSINWLYNNWQGEAASVWPLRMFGNEMYNKTNELYRDKEKYGYRLSSVSVDSHIEGPISLNTFNWENDHFTAYRANQLAKEARDGIRKLDFKASCWALGEYGVKLADALNVNYYTPHYVDKAKIKKYKERKLNLS